MKHAKMRITLLLSFAFISNLSFSQLSKGTKQISISSNFNYRTGALIYSPGLIDTFSAAGIGGIAQLNFVRSNLLVWGIGIGFDHESLRSLTKSTSSAASLYGHFTKYKLFNDLGVSFQWQSYLRLGQSSHTINYLNNHYTEFNPFVEAYTGFNVGLIYFFTSRMSIQTAINIIGVTGHVNNWEYYLDIGRTKPKFNLDLIYSFRYISDNK